MTHIEGTDIKIPKKPVEVPETPSTIIVPIFF